MDEPLEFRPNKNPVDLDVGKRLVQVVLLVMGSVALALGLWPAIWVFLHFRPGVSTAWQWTLLLIGTYLLFNLFYLLGLFLLRIILPKHKEGFYENSPDGRPAKHAALMMFNMVLARVRYAVPWATPFVAALASIPPLSTLHRFLFGPNLPVHAVGDHVRLFDPHLCKIGRRVQFGWGAKISCHIFDRRGLLIRGVEVEDDAVIGTEAWLLPGVKVGHHAMISLCSVVLPNTEIGPYEFWAGNPARKIKDLTPGESVSEVGESAAGMNLVQKPLPKAGLESNTQKTTK